jgi:hypothetical protein
MHKLQSLFYLETVLHISGVTIAYLQEHKTTVTTASGNRYTVLLSAAVTFQSPFYIKDYLNFSSVPLLPHAQRVCDIWPGVFFITPIKKFSTDINIVGISMEININSYY